MDFVSQRRQTFWVDRVNFALESRLSCTRAMRHRDLKITLIEDGPGDADVLISLLDKLGYGAIYRHRLHPNSIGAIHIFQPDVVLLCLNENFDLGLRWIQRLRQEPKGNAAGPPLIVFSPDADPAKLRTVAELDVLGYVIMPPTRQTVEQKLAQVLRLRDDQNNREVEV